MSVSKMRLKTIDAVHNEALRLALGAFRSSAELSLYCEAAKTTSLSSKRTIEYDICSKHSVTSKEHQLYPAFK